MAVENLEGILRNQSCHMEFIINNQNGENIENGDFCQHQNVQVKISQNEAETVKIFQRRLKSQLLFVAKVTEKKSKILWSVVKIFHERYDLKV